MRNWLITTPEDRQLLLAAKRQKDTNWGAWRPWRGAFAGARRLAKNGLLLEAGVSAMPPHKVYIITDKGEEELVVAASLEK